MHCLTVPCSENMSMNRTQTLAKPFGDTSPPDPLESLLQESTRRFIADYGNAVTDFSNFSSIFSRLIHSVRDPPVEVVWFYSAVTFHGARLASPPALLHRRAPAVKDLFQLLVSCSASSGAVKRIAVLSPVVYELCNLAASDKDQFEREEIQSLLEGLVSYFSICCMEIREGDGDHSLNSCFSDVVRAWLVNKVGVGDEFEAFFPIVSDEVRKRMRTAGSCGVSYLAGVVMCEAFLLRLCLKFGLEISRTDLEKDVRNCAVQMITGFRCFSFSDCLMKTLLELVLPVTNLLNSKDQCLLQDVLYDAVMMMDYSFFKPQLGLQFQSEHLKNLAITWLLVADNAIRFIRKYNNQTKVIAYISAFSQSCLASHLIEWINNQIGMEGKVARPNVLTPVALIKWMLLVEDQGIRVFDCEISKVRAKGVIYNSRVEYIIAVAKTDGETLDGGDLEMVDSLDTLAFDGQRKRKRTVDETEVQVKFTKYQFHSAKEKFPSSGSNDGLSSESEVDNLILDGDMVDMQQ